MIGKYGVDNYGTKTYKVSVITRIVKQIGKTLKRIASIFNTKKRTAASINYRQNVKVTVTFSYPER